MEPRIQYAKTSDGVSIGFCTLGDGPDLLIVPALPFSHAQIEWQTFSQFYKQLAEDFRVTWYDARGTGVSNRDNIDFSIDAMVRDAEAVADRAKIDQVILAGFSTGSLVAATLAARWSARVDKLVLVHGFVEFSDIATSAAIQTEALIDTDWETYVEAFVRVFMGYEDRAFAEYARACIDADALRAYRRDLREWDVAAILPQIKVQTLVFHPSDNPVVPVEAGRRLAAAIPGARLEIRADRIYQTVPNMIKAFAGRATRKPSTKAAPASSMTAILFADIADSTALTERLGDAAFRAKARELDGALRGVIREHSGTPIEGKLLGDGVLAVFTSARQAIEAALGCGAAGASAGMPLHLGLHAGDVIREEGNVYGGAVNVAARISGLSAAGEVLVSETVRSLARTSAGVHFEDRGERDLKGVGELVRVWAVVGERSP